MTSGLIGAAAAARHRLTLVGRLAETWVRRPPSPTRLVLDVTRRCNLRCSMCHTWKRPGRSELSATEIRDLLATMPRLVWLDVTGGEPFLRRDIHEVLQAAIDAPRALEILHFQTNGWATERIVTTTERLAAARRHVRLLVTVSIDGPPAIHDAIRGRAGAYRRAVATAGRLGALSHVEVHIGTTQNPDHPEAIDALAVALRRDLPGFDPRRWHLNALHVSEHFYGNGHLRDGLAGADLPIAKHIAARGRPRSMVELMELLYLVNLAFVQRGEPSGIPCQALRSTAFISPEGDLYPCHLYDRPLGNVRETPFAELWASRSVADARGDIEALACGGCFSACEAYPALAGAPLQTLQQTARRCCAMLATRRIAP